MISLFLFAKFSLQRLFSRELSHIRTYIPVTTKLILSIISISTPSNEHDTAEHQLVRHREVAPGQYEFAPLFGTVTTQIDQNLVVMQVSKLRREPLFDKPEHVLSAAK